MNIKSNLTLNALVAGIVSLCVLALFAMTLSKYPGQAAIYVLFTLSFNLLLWAGFRKNRFFFDTFIGLFFWLGFWLKFSIRMGLSNGAFVDPVGSFDHSPESFDRALLVSSIGALGLIAFSFLRSRLSFTYSNLKPLKTFEYLTQVYRKNRYLLLALFIVGVALLTWANGYFGIYQKGSTPRTYLPFGLGGVLTWLLLFGFTAVSTVFLDIETKTNSNPYLVSAITILESFFTNVSLLSRGMILNMSAIGVGFLAKIQLKKIQPKIRFIFILGALFGLLFASSVLAVNYFRVRTFPNMAPSFTSSEQAVKDVVGNLGPLFIDRFVGIEGAMAISSYPNLGSEIWSEAWSEKFKNSGSSLYDEKILGGTYKGVDLSQHHLISLPGSIAFFYYLGSLPVLFFALFTLGLIGALVEFIVFRFGGGNLFFCSLIGQVIAYRYAHFGYVPGQSYLLFGTILLNVVIFAALNEAAGYFVKKKP